MKLLAIEDIIRSAMEFPLKELTIRYAKKCTLSESDAERHIYELRRFLALCALNEGRAYGMLGPIDEAWHTFLLFTREYAEFCELTGGRFIHHQPSNGEDEHKNSLEGYQRFLQDYKRVFGHESPADLWPRPFMNSDNSACGGCGSCGSSDGRAPQMPETANCNGCNSCSTKS